MKYLLSIIFLTVIFSCSKKKDIDRNFTTKYWNLVINDKDSKLIEYKNQALYFKKGKAYFYNREIGNYAIVEDTLIICDTSYYDKWIIDDGVRSSAKVNIEFHKFINNDSLYRVTYTYLIGEILKSDNDSLIIRKIEGYGFPFKYERLYWFYNDTALFNPDMELDTIEFSSSLCYGKCPAIAIKVDKGLNYNFWGGKYAKKKGYYKGMISKTDFDQLQNMVRIANIEENKSIYGPPVDVPLVELIIDYDQNKTKRFRGYIRDFPPRIQNIGIKMYDLYKVVPTDSIDHKLNFEVKLDIPELRVPPPPPPERIEKNRDK